MSKEILDNLDYFSELTQRTLSAFHLSNTEHGLDDEIFNLRSSKRKLITAVINNDGMYVRTFSDGHTDIVTFSNLTTPSLTDQTEIIRQYLDKEITPVTSLKVGKNIITTNGFIPIEHPSEKIFFI